MSIGPDIKEVLAEVGVKYTILRDAGNVTGEYLTYKPNAQVTKPFIREYFLEAALSYDTKVVSGDIIQFNTTEDTYIVMNSTPALFENTVIKYESVLYKTNVLVDVLRPSNVRENYHMRTIWTTIKSQAHALISVPMFGIDLDTNEELGLIGIGNYELYLPTSYGAQVLDRIRISSAEFYRVETVKSRRYNNVDVLDIGEDVGPTTSTTTTSTTTSSSSSSSTTTTTT